MCSSTEDKERVLSQMIFPNCERLGQTIIFVQRRETGRRLHTAVGTAFPWHAARPASPCCAFLQADAFKCKALTQETAGHPAAA